YCHNPKQALIDSEYKAVQPGIRTILCCLHDSSHFVLLEITLETKKIILYDGLAWMGNQFPTSWIRHVEYVMKRTKLVPSKTKIHFRHCLKGTQGEIHDDKLYCKVGKDRWELSHEVFVKQWNTYDCGPIVGHTLLTLFGHTRKTSKKSLTDIRTYVTNQYKKLCEELCKEVKVTVSRRFCRRKKLLPPQSRTQPPIGQIMLQAASPKTLKKAPLAEVPVTSTSSVDFAKPEVSNTEVKESQVPVAPTPPVEVRKPIPPNSHPSQNELPTNASPEAKRQKLLGSSAHRAAGLRQKIQGETMRKQMDKDIDKKRARIGDKVVFKTNDAHHALEGIKGVCFADSELGGARVVTTHGIISKVGGGDIFLGC
ncbi:MAG: hypothetical protein ACRCZI_11570, partial [Cetobacterium sp.]